MRSYIGSRSRKSKVMHFVDYNEQYGQHVVHDFLLKSVPFKEVLDIGAGYGRDLLIAKSIAPSANLHAVEFSPRNIEKLNSHGVQTYQFDLETATFPFADESFDFIIANHIFEHVKEIFWLMHEVTRVLEVGGRLLIGVPNIASLHNRVGLLLGKHPTQSKACSAHVRVFSKNDVLLFLNEVFPGGYTLEAFAGSQFYPLPKKLSRFFASLSPQNAFSIFFLLEKKKTYIDSFAAYPSLAGLETNFKTL